MFEFLDMAPYKERKIANFKKGDLEIDTCAVNDSPEPYETAVKHPDYNDGMWVVVQGYINKMEAKIGHNAWVEKLSESLPDELVDKGKAGLAEFMDMVIQDEGWRIKKRRK